MVKGDLLGKGRTAEVYVWDDNRVLKLFYDWCPIVWVEREALITKTLAEAGLPVPKYFEAVKVENRRGIVLQRLEGISLMARMIRDPIRFGECVNLMADLHFQIHAKSGASLPPLRQWLRKTILQIESLDNDLRKFALDTLRSLSDGTAVCHFDFHPGQIMLTQDGPKVLDWMTALQGDPQADIAKTLVLMKVASVAHQGWRMRILVGVTRRRIRVLYLKSYCRRSKGMDLTAIRRWMIPIAAARLNERIVEEVGTIGRFLREEFKKKSA
jgi:aminoglycoside phosphotransferase (APT) family kinase protein